MTKSTLICNGITYPILILDTESEKDMVVYLLQNTNLNYYLDMLNPVTIKQITISDWEAQARSSAINYVKLKKEKKILNTAYFHWESDTLPESPKEILEGLLE